MPSWPASRPSESGAALYDHLEESGGRRQQGLSPKTVANIHGIIHKALADAVKRGKVGVNVADLVDAPRSSRTRPKVQTPEQLRAFLHHVADDRFYAAWLVFATTGMRRGEVAGLAREDWTPGPKPTCVRTAASHAVS